MRLAGIKPGDIVMCDRGGVRFHAEVVGREPNMLQIMPIDLRFSWRSATARQVVTHWARRAS